MVSGAEKRINGTTGSREGDQFGRVLKCSVHDIVNENWHLYHILSVMENKESTDPDLKKLKM